jgi:hypothetical protein
MLERADLVISDFAGRRPEGIVRALSADRGRRRDDGAT